MQVWSFKGLEFEAEVWKKTKLQGYLKLQDWNISSLEYLNGVQQSEMQNENSKVLT